MKMKMKMKTIMSDYCYLFLMVLLMLTIAFSLTLFFLLMSKQLLMDALFCLASTILLTMALDDSIKRYQECVKPPPSN